MDISTLIGIIGGIGLIIFGILWGQPSAAVLLNFVDIPSLFITVGGTFSSTLTSYKLKDFLNGLKSISIIFKSPEIDNVSVINRIIELSNVARKEGLLALEEVASGLEDEFMKKICEISEKEKMPISTAMKYYASGKILTNTQINKAELKHNSAL